MGISRIFCALCAKIPRENFQKRLILQGAAKGCISMDLVSVSNFHRLQNIKTKMSIDFFHIAVLLCFSVTFVCWCRISIRFLKITTFKVMIFHRFCFAAFVVFSCIDLRDKASKRSFLPVKSDRFFTSKNHISSVYAFNVSREHNVRFLLVKHWTPLRFIRVCGWKRLNCDFQR